jgi:hypothetical protein
MGLIGRQFQKRSNQELAAPLSTTSLLAPKEVLAAVIDVLKCHNDAEAADNQRRQEEGNRLTRWAARTAAPAVGFKHYHWGPDGQSLLISYEQRPNWIVDAVRRKRKPTPLDAYWLSRLRVFSQTNTGDPGVRVEIKLERWVINKDSGKMGNRDKYESLIDQIWEAVSVDSEDRVRGDDEPPPAHEDQTSLNL